MKSNTDHPTPPRRVLWAILLLFRLPLGIPLIAVLALAWVLKLLGHLGEYLEDWSSDMSHQLATIFNPQAWDMIREYKDRCERLESERNFWKGEAQRKTEQEEKPL